jgi:hypothetical protein
MAPNPAIAMASRIVVSVKFETPLNLTSLQNSETRMVTGPDCHPFIATTLSARLSTSLPGIDEPAIQFDTMNTTTEHYPGQMDRW